MVIGNLHTDFYIRILHIDFFVCNYVQILLLYFYYYYLHYYHTQVITTTPTSILQSYIHCYYSYNDPCYYYFCQY